MNRSTTNRLLNIAIGAGVLLSIIFNSNPDRVLLGFWLPDNRTHIIYDISVFCAYLLCGWQIYRGFVPKTPKTKTDSGDSN
jgi:hypothetical protein